MLLHAGPGVEPIFHWPARLQDYRLAWDVDTQDVSANEERYPFPFESPVRHGPTEMSCLRASQFV